ncbi:TPA: antA/AntB antirepressor family protein [Salmonella enterica subsp. diarizonae serovar 61:r:-]
MKQKNPTQGRGFLHPENSHGGNFAEIIPVISGVIGCHKTGIVSARALHSAVGAKRVFSSWFNSRVSKYGFTHGTDFGQLTPERVEITRSGRPEIDYVISLDMAKEMAMVVLIYASHGFTCHLLKIRGFAMHNDLFDVTLDQAAGSAYQAEIICKLILDSDREFTTGELEAIFTLLKQLSASAATWLIGEQGERKLRGVNGEQTVTGADHEHI